MRRFDSDSSPLPHPHTDIPSTPVNTLQSSLSCYSLTLAHQQINLLRNRMDYYERRCSKLQSVINRNTLRLAEIERLCQQLSNRPPAKNDNLLKYISSEESEDITNSKPMFQVELPLPTRQKMEDRVAQYARQIEDITAKIQSVEKLNLMTRLTDIQGTIKIQTNVSKLLGEKVQSLNTKVNMLFEEPRLHTQPLEFKKRKGSVHGRMCCKPIIF